MNQRGFVEIDLMHEDQLYRALLPMGIPWKTVHVALNKLNEQVADHLVEIEAEIKKQEEAKLAEPVEVDPEPASEPAAE